VPRPTNLLEGQTVVDGVLHGLVAEVVKQREQVAAQEGVEFDAWPTFVAVRKVGFKGRDVRAPQGRMDSITLRKLLTA